MRLTNKIMLITYADSMGNDLRDLRELLDAHFDSAIGGVHILPFFPSSADRGFAPLRYDVVDPSFGSWDDVRAIGEKRYLMFDFMINHISRHSPYFADFIAKKDSSEFADFFIRYKDFWVDEGGFPTDKQVDRIYKRKPRAPYVEVTFADGSTEKLWCTFGEEQIDLNVRSKRVQRFFAETLSHMAENNASIIRLDAFAYACKRPGSSCFFVQPETSELLESMSGLVEPYGCMVLPEIHEHYGMQMKVSEMGYWVYDFALPVLTLHALYSGDGRHLKRWLEMSPRHQFTTLDTHDGLGIVDVKDLLPDEDVDFTKEKMFSEGANVKRIYNTEAYNNLDIYQVNTTYYSALGNDDDSYVLARAIQFFAKGIPMVYYVGLLAGANDLELLERTKEGRNINRHYYSREEVAREVGRPVVRRLVGLMELRNSHPAFDIDGEFEVSLPKPGLLRIRRGFRGDWAQLDANLERRTFEITHS
ncbi:sucrose phosphorylase [Olsenella sp. HMSC062G07]|uniref:sucrose phosphorylase n=1 Tax=Olsenella sp. HMSC062G07 TaxID=1739330 RepID=UPI0008A56CB0|nr:sucrose phosphorylase [Olsenella sp. HMSC062G07]OFK22692.1 sucrose phosphorylase [Olsenella sp. HMSC062G07]